MILLGVRGLGSGLTLTLTLALTAGVAVADLIHSTERGLVWRLGRGGGGGRVRVSFRVPSPARAEHEELDELRESHDALHRLRPSSRLVRVRG